MRNRGGNATRGIENRGEIDDFLRNGSPNRREVVKGRGDHTEYTEEHPPKPRLQGDAPHAPGNVNEFIDSCQGGFQNHRIGGFGGYVALQTKSHPDRRRLHPRGIVDAVSQKKRRRLAGLAANNGYLLLWAFRGVGLVDSDLGSEAPHFLVAVPGDNQHAVHRMLGLQMLNERSALGPWCVMKTESRCVRTIDNNQADVGRPLTNINPTIEIPALQSLVLQVMSNLRQMDRQITDRQGARSQLRILPYRTSENRIDGAIITIIDIASCASSETGAV